MESKRRNFIKGCAAACTLLLPGMASAAQSKLANTADASELDLRIEKSIKAAFGGGFSVQEHSQSNGLTHAVIEHFGNRYAVASSNLLDWEILRTL